jgi:hypothetical protein
VVDAAVHHLALVPHRLQKKGHTGGVQVGLVCMNRGCLPVLHSKHQRQCRLCCTPHVHRMYTAPVSFMLYTD